MRVGNLRFTEIFDSLAGPSLRIEAVGATIETRSCDDWKKNGADAAMAVY